MNNVTLIGNLTADPQLREASNGTKYMFFTVACNFSKKDGDNWVQDVDYVPCVAFGKTAETINDYFSKGTKIAVTQAKVKTSVKENDDGTKTYSTNVSVQKIEFCEKSSGSKASTSKSETVDDGDEPF